MAAHILYEKRMWDFANAQLLVRTSESIGNSQYRAGIRNCLIESYLLHQRTLTEFFCSTSNSKEDDVFAFDYIPEWDAGQDGIMLTSSLRSLNKRWGHLTLLRTKSDTRAADEKVWLEGHGPILRLYRSFLSRLGDDERSWFEASDSV